MPHPYTALVWGMGASLICFYTAFFFRVRNNALHRRLAALGVVLNLLSSVYLIWSVRLAGIEMGSAYPLAVVTAHRAFATVMALVMLLMVYTGMRHKLTLHRGLSRLFLPGYTLTYFSGMVVFHS